MVSVWLATTDSAWTAASGGSLTALTVSDTVAMVSVPWVSALAATAVTHRTWAASSGGPDESLAGRSAAGKDRALLWAVEPAWEVGLGSSLTALTVSDTVAMAESWLPSLAR